jgi:hypothetical protein
MEMTILNNNWVATWVTRVVDDAALLYANESDDVFGDGLKSLRVGLTAELAEVFPYSYFTRWFELGGCKNRNG